MAGITLFMLSFVLQLYVVLFVSEIEPENMTVTYTFMNSHCVFVPIEKYFLNVYWILELFGNFLSDSITVLSNTFFAFVKLKWKSLGWTIKSLSNIVFEYENKNSKVTLCLMSSTFRRLWMLRTVKWCVVRSGIN